MGLKKNSTLISGQESCLRGDLPLARRAFRHCGNIAGGVFWVISSSFCVVIVLFWCLSAGRARTYISYDTADSCRYVASDSGRLRVGKIGGFPHGYGADAESAWWLRGFTFAPDIPSLGGGKQRGERLSRYLFGSIRLFVGERTPPSNIAIRCISAPHWLVAGVLLVPASLLSVRYYRGARRRWRVRKGLCITCGYDLRGAASDVCSECGTTIRETESRRLGLQRR